MTLTEATSTALSVLFGWRMRWVRSPEPGGVHSAVDENAVGTEAHCNFLQFSDRSGQNALLVNSETFPVAAIDRAFLTCLLCTLHLGKRTMAESIGRIIDALEDTPIPTILIFAGLFFILLAFVTKVGGFIEVQPAQQKWAAPIGIALLVFGLILALNTPPGPPEPESPSPAPTSSPAPTATPRPTGCAAFFLEGNSLNWEITGNNGRRVNGGTLRIDAIDAAAGTWRGEQMTEANGSSDRMFTNLAGSFKGTEMTLDNPASLETWSGTCGSDEIKGALKTDYETPEVFRFEIQKR